MSNKKNQRGSKIFPLIITRFKKIIKRLNIEKLLIIIQLAYYTAKLLEIVV